VSRANARVPVAFSGAANLTRNSRRDADCTGASSWQRFTRAMLLKSACLYCLPVALLSKQAARRTRLQTQTFLLSRSVRNRSQLGGAPGAIVPVLPDTSSDEALLIRKSIFFRVARAPEGREKRSRAQVSRRNRASGRASETSSPTAASDKV
jgi:hypothetical protein